MWFAKIKKVINTHTISYQNIYFTYNSYPIITRARGGDRGLSVNIVSAVAHQQRSSFVPRHD
jgi:hypothetical protein